MQLVFATNNKHKVKEIKAILPPSVSILGLKDIGCTEELPETHTTIEENSLEKAVYVYEKYGFECFAEDSGLEVEALDGEPGVDSAHYSGSRDADANIHLLLLNLRGIKNRRAQFKTVFTLVTADNKDQFHGIVTGEIISERRGEHGFGYDPVFVPYGHLLTFAEMDEQEKIKISHRTKAFEKLTAHILSNF